MPKSFRYELSQQSCMPDRIVASACVPADSAWFSGHFPGNPIVPGVALIAFVEETILNAEQDKGRIVEITGLRRVRFRLPVKPDDHVILEVNREAKQEVLVYGFNVYLGGETACSGVLTAKVVSS